MSIRCPTCVQSGKSSVSFLIECRVQTDEPVVYFDSNGRQHFHDSNITTNQYRCSEDHEWEESRQSHCWCGFPNQRSVRSLRSDTHNVEQHVLDWEIAQAKFPGPTITISQ